MKEFIDKLIEELESVKSIVNSPADIVWNNAVKMCIYKVNELAEEYKGGWIPCSSGVMPKVLQWVLIQTTQGDMDVIRYIGEEECYGNDFYHRIHPRMVVAWCELPAPYTEEEVKLYRAKSVDGEYQEYKEDWK